MISYDDMQLLMFTTISKSYDHVFATLSEKGYGNVDDYAYRSLVAFVELSKHYDESKHEYHTGPHRQLSAGIFTATMLIAFLLKHMSESSLINMACKKDIVRSSQPLQRLAAVNVNDLIAIQDYILKPLDGEHMFVQLPNGRIDFSDTVQDSLRKTASIPSNDESPTLGCPVTFKPKQLQNLWQWGVNIVITAGLITPSDYRADR